MNMNVNEVIMNFVLIKMGYQFGEYQYFYLNDDVNWLQLINDVYLMVMCLVMVS